MIEWCTSCGGQTAKGEGRHVRDCDVHDRCTRDPVNPQVAARLARCFDRWRKFDAGRQTHARAALESLRGTLLRT